MKFSFKHLLGGGIIGVILLITSFVSLPDGKFHLVFCDVGQGDAIYVRSPQGSDILFDGGPNEKVLSCLSKHMPFYDRTVELVLLSHAQADHLNGLISVLERYNVNYFVSSGIGNTTEGYKQLTKLLEEKNVPQKIVGAGGKVGIDGVELVVLWPENVHLGGVLRTPSEVGTDINENSLIVRLGFGKFASLLTGDAGTEILSQIGQIRQIGMVDVLKVPHHGSKTGMTEAFLEEIRPKLAVISVGKNSYGHPTREILGMLGGLGIKTLRTDLDGEVEIVSDGKRWEVR